MLIAKIVFRISTPGSKLDAILEENKIGNPKKQNKLSKNLLILTTTLRIYVLDDI